MNLLSKKFNMQPQSEPSTDSPATSLSRLPKRSRVLPPSPKHFYSFALILSTLPPFSGGQFLRLREEISCQLGLEQGGGRTEQCSQLPSSLGRVGVSRGRI